VPCAFVFTKDSIRIINTSQAPAVSGKSFTPTYLVKKAQEISEEIKERFSSFQLLSGEFWATEKDHFAFDRSAHKTLLDKLRLVREAFLKEDTSIAKPINRLLIQCVLIRYLEEKQDFDGKGNLRTVFPQGFFENISKGKGGKFKHALEAGTFWDVFVYLNQQEHLNGRIFEWPEEEKQQIQTFSTSKLVNLLYEVRSSANDQLALWDLYSFQYLPVEIVSSIYEALFSTTQSVREDGMVYTPPHLAAFLVDEAMPLNAWKDKKDFKILDPSCGSGVFLVLAFKRLVHWWRLQNNGASPARDELINILRHSIHGVDKEEAAILLTRFSLCLALCDMLTPPEIWDALRFPDLEGQLVNNDFFDWHKENRGKQSFDLVIGNPPYKQAHKRLPDWKSVSDFKIPQGQIALYFLSAGTTIVKPNGLLCLLIKSSSFLYTTTGGKYRTDFLLHNQVHQVVDFTLLARNNVLWNNEEPDTVAIFATPGNVDLNKKILHVVVRRSPSTRTKRYFEIDTYDFNWIPYQSALQDDFVWKTNLLGGGRLYGIIKYLKTFPTLKDYFDKMGWKYGEGYQTSQVELPKKAEYITGKPYLPYDWITSKGIINKEFPIEKSTEFSVVRNKKIYTPPHILFHKVINEDLEFSVAFSDEYLVFKKQIVGINAPSSQREQLFHVFESLKSNGKFFHGFIFSTSPRCLVFKNTSLNPDDIYQLPFDPTSNIKVHDLDQLILNDVVNHYQNFIRHPASSKAFHPIASKNFKTHISNFGAVFCKALNALYAQRNLRFRQAESGFLHYQKFIFVAFCYDDQPDNTASLHGKVLNEGDLAKLMILDKGQSEFQRIIKIYKKDYICFIKPNQFRYWLDSIALRDADSVINDLVAKGH